MCYHSGWTFPTYVESVTPSVTLTVCVKNPEICATHFFNPPDHFGHGGVALRNRLCALFATVGVFERNTSPYLYVSVTYVHAFYVLGGKLSICICSRDS